MREVKIWHIVNVPITVVFYTNIRHDARCADGTPRWRSIEKASFVTTILRNLKRRSSAPAAERRRDMAYFHTCSLCGAHLDPGERCDCEEQKKPPTEVAIPQTAGNQRMANYNTHIIQEGWWSVNGRWNPRLA